MDLPKNKIKIVCTIGPASESLRSWQTKKNGRPLSQSKATEASVFPGGESIRRAGADASVI